MQEAANCTLTPASQASAPDRARPCGLTAPPRQAYDEAAEALAAEERTKEQLCAELNMLVQQSAHAQLDKLDQLTRRLELLNSGITLAGAHQGLGQCGAERAGAGWSAGSSAAGGRPSGAAHMAWDRAWLAMHGRCPPWCMGSARLGGLTAPLRTWQPWPASVTLLRPTAAALLCGAEEARTAAGSLGEQRTASGEAAHLAAAVQHDADALRSKILAAANGAVAPLHHHHHHHQEQQGVVDLAYDSSNPFVGPPAGEAAATPSSATQHQQAVHDQERVRREAALEQQRAQRAAEAERQRQEAEAARSRHITIGRGRGGRPATQQPQAAGRGPAAAPLELVGGGRPAGRPRAVTDQGGEFRGFA